MFKVLMNWITNSLSLVHGCSISFSAGYIHDVVKGLPYSPILKKNIAPSIVCGAENLCLASA